jgi:hypothetical protein
LLNIWGIYKNIKFDVKINDNSDKTGRQDAAIAQ